MARRTGARKPNSPARHAEYSVHAKVSSVSRFMSVVQSIADQWDSEQPATPTIWFRGQSSAEWSLLPGLYRPGNHPDDEDSFRDAFRLRAHPYLSEVTYRPADDWDWYFLMQHYGLPTRLLDWSESALVALLFAVLDEDASRDGAVWVLDPFVLNREVTKKGDILYSHGDRVLRRYLSPAWESSTPIPKTPIAFDPPYNSKRLVAQRGRFTIHGSDRRGVDAYALLRKRLLKIVVPGAEKWRVKEQLAFAGITESVIYPDLAGLSRDIAYEWQTRTRQPAAIQR